jgi:hypothetical protein
MTLNGEASALGLCADEPEGRDLAVKIEIDGRTRCFCKAKHEAARQAGAMHDLIGGTFFVDRVRQASSAK